MDIIDAIHSAGLLTPNIRDATPDMCTKLHCLSAADSDTVSILKFPGSPAAQRYSGAISNSYQHGGMVLVFALTDTASQKAAYEHVMRHAVD